MYTSNQSSDDKYGPSAMFMCREKSHYSFITATANVFVSGGNGSSKYGFRWLRKQNDVVVSDTENASLLEHLIFK